MQAEMISDAIDDALDNDEAEDETEELTNQVHFINCCHGFVWILLLFDLDAGNNCGSELYIYHGSIIKSSRQSLM